MIYLFILVKRRQRISIRKDANFFRGLLDSVHIQNDFILGLFYPNCESSI